VHTEVIKKLPSWFDTFFNTPYYHGVHHATDTLYLDKNHGATLIIWDKLYGTFQPAVFQPNYGVTTKMDSQNPVFIAFAGWKDLWKDVKKATNPIDIFHFVFDSPGWSPDGSSKTARQMQREINDSGMTRTNSLSLLAKNDTIQSQLLQ
jgi:hypothetical protein